MGDNGEFYGEIYKATCTKGKLKCYIGQTTVGSEKRWKQHVAEAKTRNGGCWALNSAILKYGADSFVIEVLQICATREELDECEDKLIKEYNTRAPNGYNIRSGGAKGPPSEDSRLKMSLSHMGEKNHNYGKAKSEETKAKMSKAATGKKHTKEHVFNQSQAHKKSGLPMYIRKAKATLKRSEGYIVKAPNKQTKDFRSGQLTMEEKLKLAIEYLNS